MKLLNFGLNVGLVNKLFGNIIFIVYDDLCDVCEKLWICIVFNGRCLICKNYIIKKGIKYGDLCKFWLKKRKKRDLCKYI